MSGRPPTSTTLGRSGSRVNDRCQRHVPTRRDERRSSRRPRERWGGYVGIPTVNQNERYVRRARESRFCDQNARRERRPAQHQNTDLTGSPRTHPKTPRILEYQGDYENVTHAKNAPRSSETRRSRQHQKHETAAQYTHPAPTHPTNTAIASRPAGTARATYFTTAPTAPTVSAPPHHRNPSAGLH